jgi:chemotaxis protein CheZ
MSDVTDNREIYLERVKMLANSLEAGNDDEAERLLDEITQLRERSLFQELGRLTRQFHEALNSFRLDARIAELAEKEFPDARERLRYVVKMTAESADRSLTATENAMPLCKQLESGASEMQRQWQSFTRREMDLESFRRFSSQLNGFLSSVHADSGAIRDHLNDVVMAQDFQDLTGQIIGRVITLVDDMEKSLVELIRISGQKMVVNRNPEEKPAAVNPIEAEGPVIPGVSKGDIVSGQDEVDDLLSSLGF